MRTEPAAPGSLARVLLAALPAGERNDLARGMFAEAMSLPPGPERRGWMLSAHLYALRAGRAAWSRLAVAAASGLFILWIAYNALDSGFSGTAPEIASALGVVLLLGATVALITPWTLLRAGLRRRPSEPDA